MRTPVSLDFGLDSFTFGLWVAVEHAVGRWDIPLYKGGSTASNAGYDMELGLSSWRAAVSDGRTLYDGEFGVDPAFNGRWAHLIAVVDRSSEELRLYADGAEVDVIDITGLGSVDNNRSARLGVADYPILGRIDELRLYRRAVTVDEIALEHANLMTPGFLSIGAEELAP